ncbi:hypothetical protein Tsubulata_001231 [Turnera subulata]|uniref:Non-haem dioxygenase N-terminal domain-containing protein n=1 Tax=Turnera subulata TaxID=218843 RepID=A0A9Q0F8J5_9ROSI|nr:hypothetical protein Tsubulata_001231 [Turnera subulata]
MDTKKTSEALAESPCYYDRKSELKAFDDTEAGVKGLLDARVTKIPRIFFKTENFPDKQKPSGGNLQLSIPIIDLGGIVGKDPSSRKETIDKVGDACREWGFFQVINHGIPDPVMDDKVDGIRKFHELDTEAKKKYYGRDLTKKVFYLSNFDLYQAAAANWRDSFGCNVAPGPPTLDELPDVCR